MALDDTERAPAPPSAAQPGLVPARRGGLTWGPLAILVFWLTIMGALYALMTQYLKPKPFSMTATGDLVIPKHRDGHFYVKGAVNGRAVSFLVDTGASTVVVSEAFARNAGIGDGISTVFKTANGDLRGRMVQDVPVSIGPIQVSGVRVGVGLEGGPDDEALLGQSLLSKFDVIVTKDQMILRPR